MQSAPPEGSSPSHRKRFPFVSADPARLTYICFAGACVLFAARLFYASLRLQIFYSGVRHDPYLLPSDWSAPLDDVFIHFDFARSIARGHPFEWSPGNGYSSGGTSLLYPFVLAPGFYLGFGGQRLMQFAAIVACTSIFATLLWVRRMFRGLPLWTVFIAPPVLLSVGALDWSLFSGMEVAFFLAVWAATFVAWDEVTTDRSNRTRRAETGSVLALGLANGLLVATRPEAIVVAFVFGATAAFASKKRHGIRTALGVLLASMAFALCVVVSQAVANRVLTGDFSAAGALVKLELYDPRLTARDVWDAWVFHVRYQVGRVTGYHLAGGLAWGSFFWVLAALPVVFRETRRYGLLLWAQAVAWVFIVALNGQVRWQNERYTMPAVAWMLLAVALGIAAATSHRYTTRARDVTARFGVLVLVAVLAWQQGPRMRDQIWFFGRASRNIRDQHVKVGRFIREEMPGAHRVLVSDAGAIPYASDLPALDLIGLGGYRRLPFARASRWGVGAAIELIERIPARDRPDMMAIYPSWWGDFPLWFGLPIAGVSVRGNVICGGLTDMIYAADWDALDSGRAPATPRARGGHVIDEIDFADLLSEAVHGYRTVGAPGFVTMKILPRPGRPDRGLWDAGRVVPPGAAVAFVLRGIVASTPMKLWVRTAPSRPARLRLRVDDADVAAAALEPRDAWQEISLAIPKERVRPEMVVELAVERNEVVLYHAWGESSK